MNHLAVCLSVYLSVSIHLSVYPPLTLGAFEAYEIIFLSVCVLPPNFFGVSVQSLYYQRQVGD
jgi:hypothetical protein